MVRAVADVIPALAFGMTEEFPVAHFQQFLRMRPELQQAAMDLGGNKWMDSHGGALPGSYGRWVRTVGFSPLGAADLVFKLVPYRLSLRLQEMNGQVPDYAVAVADAEYQTFQTQLSPSMGNLSAFINSHPAFGFIVPFFRTLVNLINRTFDYTPVLSQMRNVDNYRGPVEARNLAFAQALVGTVLSALAVFLHGSGDDEDDSVLSGMGPTQYDRRAAWLANNEPLGLQVGDWLVPMWRIEPFAGMMGLSIAAADAVRQYQKDAPLEDVFGPLGSSFIHMVVGKSFMQGASDLLNGLTAAERGSSWKYFSETLPQSIVLGATIPNAITQVGDVIDPYKREAKGWEEQFLRRLPWKRDELEHKLDYKGQPIIEPRYGTILPVQRVPRKEDRVAAMLFHLNQPLIAQPKAMQDAVNEVKQQLIELGIPREKAIVAAENLRKNFLEERYTSLTEVREDALTGAIADLEELESALKSAKTMPVKSLREELREELNAMRVQRGLPPKEFEPLK